jgi:DNA-binding HxlR family transcriptional regulator
MPYQPKRKPLDPCPVEEVLEVISGKWKARILFLISIGPSSFSALRKAIPRVSREVLSTQLQSLIDDCILERCHLGGPAELGAVYRLTSEGRSLLPVLDTIAAWGNERLRERGHIWQAPAACDRVSS